MQRSSTVRALMLAATAALAAAVPASAVTTVTTVNGANWQIHDIAPPKLDTGSIRAISDNAFYGFGGIRVRVSGVPASDPSARLNGELMRGFGLTFDGEDAFKTAAPIVLGGVAISRDIKLSKPGNWTRWIDSFANTTQRTITVDVAFGGSAGQNSGSNQSVVQATSSGDARDRHRRHLGPGRQPGGQRRQLARPARRGARHAGAAPATSSATRSATRCPPPAWRPTSTPTRTR